MKTKYTKKQIQESIKHWQKVLENLNETEVPVISSIKDFLDICKEKNIEVKKDKVSKQGKIVNATIADEDKEIKSREGKEIAKKGDLVVDDGDDTFYAVNSKDISKYYELDKDGNSITGDNTKWKKIGKELEYYITPFDVDVKVQWQDKPLHATKGYSLVCNDKDGKDISPVAPEVFNDKTLWIKKMNENMKSKYTKKQIQESIKHWQKVLESMYDGKSILHEFNVNVNMLDDELKKKLDIRLDILRDLIFKIKPTVNLPDEDIPLENELGYAIVDFIKGLVLNDVQLKQKGIVTEDIDEDIPTADYQPWMKKFEDSSASYVRAIDANQVNEIVQKSHDKKTCVAVKTLVTHYQGDIEDKMFLVTIFVDTTDQHLAVDIAEKIVRNAISSSGVNLEDIQIEGLRADTVEKQPYGSIYDINGHIQII